ncbi:MAG: hypothetical protein D9V45_01480 [Chloroflexi bacterium]|nr:MAG: hypothetical protein D9V45_01480 [Chloroflexota bacterium]
MPGKDLDFFIAQDKKNPVELRGYVWKVIMDPTRVDDDPGMFYGRLFRMIDIRLNRDEKSTWPEGIVFEHIASGCRLTYKDGLLMDLTNSKVIQKKPRIRDRSRRPDCRNQAKGESMARKQNQISSNSQMRRFVLIRVEDLTGVSGTGEVAEGTVFSSGLAVIHWLREPYAMGVYQTLEDVISVHGHEGRTQLQFID